MILKDKVAVVTGGGAGMGQGIVLEFIKEGAKVVYCDINDEALANTSKLIDELGGDYLAVHCDIFDSSQVHQMFKDAVAKYGTVNVLVNNAARVPSGEVSRKRRAAHSRLVNTAVPRHSLEITRNMSDEEWKSFFDVNVHGTFYTVREALNIMEPKGSGQIINVSSIAGISAMSAHSPHYSATKGAVVAFTKSVAAEVAGSDVCVNAVAPGAVATPGLKEFAANLTPEARASFFQMCPAGRMGEIEEYVSLFVYLASGKHYLVGQIISPNGDIVI